MFKPAKLSQLPSAGKFFFMPLFRLPPCCFRPLRPCGDADKINEGSGVHRRGGFLTPRSVILFAGDSEQCPMKIAFDNPLHLRYRERGFCEATDAASGTIAVAAVDLD